MVKNKGAWSRSGDTLIEVTLAIGIFSMVAIAAVSVINASVSSTQGVLENTLTREEIDAQAEALRFIQAAYAAEGDASVNNQSNYAKMWLEIEKRAVSLTDANKDIVNYSPSTCASVYSDSSLMDKAFVINTRALSREDADKVVVTPGGSSVFRETTTYPRILYKSNAADDSLHNSSEILSIAGGSNYNIEAVEGIFVLAVNDSDGTTVISDENGKAQTVSAYVDFYIRSCWYAVNAERPSTISTVIRLYNPDSVAISRLDRKVVMITYDKNGADVVGTMDSQYVMEGVRFIPLANKYSRANYVFEGWSTSPDYNSSGATIYQPGVATTAPRVSSGSSTMSLLTLYARWRPYGYIVKFNANGNLANGPEGYMGNWTLNINDESNEVQIPTNRYVWPGYHFIGWSDSPSGPVKWEDGGTFVRPVSFRDGDSITLYAQWEMDEVEED